MRVDIVTPAPPRSRYGNRVTALRWARMLGQLGHRVSVLQEYSGEPCDLLIALHARRSFPSVSRFRSERPSVPLIVALTGTDLYQDLQRGGRALRSLDLADRLVLLQPKGIEALPRHVRSKARVIYQSCSRPAGKTCRAPRRHRHFNVCVVGHLRSVKDPFRAARAARLLPEWSRIRILHAGGSMSDTMAARARAEMRSNRRYRWLGELPPWRVRRIFAQSDL